MNIRKIAAVSVLFTAFIVFINATFKGGEKDPLHKRNFNIEILEKKNEVAAKKTTPDELSFKDGKLFSGFLKEKFQYSWLKYRINKDTIFYVDSLEREVRRLEVECTTTDAQNLTLNMSFAVENEDIEGTIKITKNDKPKKMFEFWGLEKGGKPKKERKPKVPKNAADSLKKQ